MESQQAEMKDSAIEEALVENEKFDETKAAENAEAERVAAEEQAAHEEYVKKTEIEEQAKIAELREKLGQNLEQDEPVNPEQTEKANEAKNVLMQLFDKAGWSSFSKLKDSSENILDELGDAEQEQLAKIFYNETIGRSISNNSRAYQVYGEFKGTAFAKKFANLEDARLKSAGYAGFIL